MSEYKYLDKDGLIYYHSKIKTLLNGKVDTVSGKGLSTNDYTTNEKNKLSGIATGAEVNQNAFSNVAVGETTIAADSKTDTLTLTAGSNITLTPNATSDTITIAATDTTYSEATTSAAGLMSSSDKTKLNGVATGAEVNQNAFSNVKVGSTTVQADAKTDTLELVAGSNVTLTPDATNDKITIAATDTTYSDVTTSTHGLMTAADKVKLNGIAEGATANTGTITGVSVNGTSVATSGVANITSMPASILSGAIPSAVTATTQTAGNNSTKIATTAFVTKAVADGIASITGISFEIVQTLPSTGEAGTIYLVSHGGTGTNVYDEYIYVNNAWEKIGTTDVDLSGYVQKTELVSITNAEIDTIVA